MAIRRIAVIGAGLMGHGIAQVAATFGYDVVLRDIDQAILERGLTMVRGSLEKFVRSGQLDAERAEEIANSIRLTTSLEDALAEADYVFEAIPEVLELKQELFADMDRLAPAKTILATNTSELSPTAIASKTRRPDRAIATHWFNPPPLMPLVEVVRALDTSDATLETTLELCRSLKKETVICRKDTQGFIVSRALLAQRAEALRMLEEGLASVDEIDRAIELGLNHRMGPFKLADYVGLDTGLRNLEYMAQAHGERFMPSSTLRNLVTAGRLGRKSGRGFYDYGQPVPQRAKAGDCADHSPKAHEGLTEVS